MGETELATQRALRPAPSLTKLPYAGADEGRRYQRPEERTVLDAIDGRRSVREIVAATRLSSFDVCKILYQLLSARLVRA